MGGYFRPLRRKIGVVMLVLACLLAAALVRSFCVEDDIVVPILGSHIELGSTSGFLIYFRCPEWQRAAWNTHEIEKSSYFTFIVQTDYEWDLDWGGFRCHNSGNALMIPYCFIVIPLTLLSAWLLLSKPRAQKGADST